MGSTTMDIVSCHGTLYILNFTRAQCQVAISFTSNRSQLLVLTICPDIRKFFLTRPLSIILAILANSRKVGKFFKIQFVLCGRLWEYRNSKGTLVIGTFWLVFGVYMRFILKHPQDFQGYFLQL